MKKISVLVLLTTFFFTQGCGTFNTFHTKGELRNKTKQGEHACGLSVLPIFAGDVLIAYSANWNKDERFMRNYYQGAFATVGLVIVDGFISDCLYKWFYEIPDPSKKENKDSK